MTKLYALLIGLMLLGTSVWAQISEGGEPLGKTLSLSLEPVERTQLNSFNLQQVQSEDATVEEKQGTYPRIGRVLPVGISLNDVNAWTEVKGGRVWRHALKSRDAVGLSVQFENFEIPAGAKLFIHSPDYQQVIGAFTEFNNHESGVFSTQPIHGDEVIVEYFEPTAVMGQGKFEIAGLVHVYRMMPQAEGAQRDFGDSDPCQVNVNCSEGNNWQNQKRGVVRIFIIEGQFAGWCSGSLINNTAQDCTPYVLTALHCGINASTANMNQWVFFFNYESAGCANGTAGQVPNNTMTGCARIADSGDGGGNSGSDYMLVELNNDVPESYNPFYNGWRRTNVTSSSGVSIHHPSGDIKKISTYSSNLISTSWGGPSGSHWMVTWVSTSNGHGVTEGGSSGSPIFDNQGRIIGTLTGGSSFCTSPSSPDLYGKMSYHWNSNPGDNLSTYLDPTNSGANTLDGSNNPCGSSGGGGDCEAGTVSVSVNQNVCPGEAGIFNATGVEIPSGGGYAVQFVPGPGGTGGNGTGFTITGVEPLPFEFDNDINGILSANSFPPLSGAWVLTGFVYTDPEDAGGSFCSIANVDVTVNFLSTGDPACDGSGNDCITDIPFPENDPCVIQVLAQDPFCCDTEWDEICDDQYFDCLSGGGADCDAGTISVALTQDICPGEEAIFNATGVDIPEGGNYAVGFDPGPGATGGVPAGFSITGAAPLPFEFDAGINGILAANDLDPLGGQWILTGIVYTDPDDFAGSVCAFTDQEIIVNFLSASDPVCDGDCITDIPYPLDDPCVLIVIDEDPWCCDTEWDELCDAAYEDCISGPITNDDCADAITVTAGTHPFSTIGATTDGPDHPGTDCDAFEQSNVNNDVWYEFTATCDGTGIFSTCGTADFDTKIAVYSSGVCPPPASALIICNDDFDGCSGFSSYLEWDITEGTTYLLRIGGWGPNDSGTGTFLLNQNCDGEEPGDCLIWVNPSPTTGWNDFNTEFDGAPVPDPNGNCPFNEITDFEVWQSEAYSVDGFIEGVTYTFSHCNGLGAGTWTPTYAIIAPSGAIDASGLGDGDGCSITWTASESGTYLIVINDVNNCGVAGNTDNGFPALTCALATSVEEVATNTFGVFPNPNKGQFNITFEGAGGLAQIDVLEVSGKTVFTSQFNFAGEAYLPVDLGRQAGGMYFVRITMNDQVNVMKVTVH